MLAIGHGAGLAGTRNTGAHRRRTDGAVCRELVSNVGAGEWARVRALGIAGRSCPDARMDVRVCAGEGRAREEGAMQQWQEQREQQQQQQQQQHGERVQQRSTREKRRAVMHPSDGGRQTADGRRQVRRRRPLSTPRCAPHGQEWEDCSSAASEGPCHSPKSPRPAAFSAPIALHLSTAKA
jgi:hypothetical protein